MIGLQGAVFVCPAVVVQARQIEMKRSVVERLVVDLEVDLEVDLGEVLEAEVLAIGMAVVLVYNGSVEGVVGKRILLVRMDYLEVVLACLLEVVVERILAVAGRSPGLLAGGQEYSGWMAVGQMAAHYRGKLLWVL